MTNLKSGLFSEVSAPVSFLSVGGFLLLVLRLNLLQWITSSVITHIYLAAGSYSIFQGGKTLLCVDFLMLGGKYLDLRCIHSAQKKRTCAFNIFQ